MDFLDQRIPRLADTVCVDEIEVDGPIFVLLAHFYDLLLDGGHDGLCFADTIGVYIELEVSLW